MYLFNNRQITRTKQLQTNQTRIHSYRGIHTSYNQRRSNVAQVCQ